MIDKLKIFFAALAVAMLTGCGHNAVQFSKGVGFDAGFDPEHMSARINLRYGEILSVAARDNLDVELATGIDGGQEQATASTRTDSSLKIHIGPQVNGYLVEAVEAGLTPETIRALHDYPTAAEK